MLIVLSANLRCTHMQKQKISRDEALSFLLTYIVVERNNELMINQIVLFQLSNVAQQAVDQINGEIGVIPHEVIERLANEFLEQQ